MALSRPARTLAAALFVALAALVPTAAAHACTVCDSPTGRQVRAGLLNGHFLHTLAVVLAPVPVFAAAVGLLHFGMPDLALPSARPEVREPELLA